MFLTSDNFRDFYIKYDGDFNFDPDRLEENSPEAMIINKLIMIIFTNAGEVLGDVEMGADLEFYLWNTNVSAEYIRDILIEQIKEYITELGRDGLPFLLATELLKGNGERQDILLIDFRMEKYELKAAIQQ